MIVRSVYIYTGTYMARTPGYIAHLYIYTIQAPPRSTKCHRCRCDGLVGLLDGRRVVGWELVRPVVVEEAAALNLDIRSLRVYIQYTLMQRGDQPASLGPVPW